MSSQAILLYVLKSVFTSGIFLGYYWIALRNRQFNYYNRFYLLLSIVCSLVIPLFRFNWFTIAQEEAPVAHGTISFISTSMVTAGATTFSWHDMALYASVAISSALLMILLFSVYKVYRLKRQSAVVKMEGVDFVYTTLDSAPFSFLNNLFWKEDISLEEDYGQKVFKHEITHINQKHTLDVLFCQVVNAIFWMNPFNRLIEKELKSIHEFIADKEAVGNNNVEDFVQLLLQAHFGKNFLNITHAFHYSSIKRRLFMLTAKNNARFSYARRLLVLPITVLVIGSLSVSTIESKATPAEATPALVNDPVPVVAPPKALVKNDTTPAPKKASFTTVIKKKTPKGESEADVTTEKIVIQSRKHAPPIPKDILCFVDGQEISYDELTKMAPDNIESINVLKGESAVKIYGSRGANGVLEVKTKNAPRLITKKSAE